MTASITGKTGYGGVTVALFSRQPPFILSKVLRIYGSLFPFFLEHPVSNFLSPTAPRPSTPNPPPEPFAPFAQIEHGHIGIGVAQPSRWAFHRDRAASAPLVVAFPSACPRPGAIALFHVDPGRPGGVLTQPFPGPADGLAAGLGRGEVRGGGQPTQTLRGHLGPAVAVAVRPSQQQFLSAGSDGLVLVWEHDAALADGHRQRLVAAAEAKRRRAAHDEGARLARAARGREAEAGGGGEAEAGRSSGAIPESERWAASAVAMPRPSDPASGRGGFVTDIRGSGPSRDNWSDDESAGDVAPARPRDGAQGRRRQRTRHNAHS
jgi:hypothetical protein